MGSAHSVVEPTAPRARSSAKTADQHEVCIRCADEVSANADGYRLVA
jgi:hypothetical protein